HRAREVRLHELDVAVVATGGRRRVCGQGRRGRGEQERGEEVQAHGHGRGGSRTRGRTEVRAHSSTPPCRVRDDDRDGPIAGTTGASDTRYAGCPCASRSSSSSSCCPPAAKTAGR